MELYLYKIRGVMDWRTMMENLWPNFNEMQKIKTPKEILDEQGKLLPKLTNELVFASIDSSNVFNSDFTVGTKYDFTYDFNIRGKYLENYKFKLITVGHNISIYPARVRLEPELRKEAGITKQDIIIETQNDFINLLRDVFNSNILKYVIASIMSMSK